MLQINTLSRLDLGVKDENLARDLYIDMNAWYTDYPNGSFSIWHKRNGDETKYAASGVTFDRDSGILKWTPDAYDTFYIGKGLAEIRCTENDVIKKTKDIVTEVARSLVLGSGETLASGWQNFLNAVEDAKNGAEQAQGAAEDAQEAAEAAAEAAEAATEKAPYINETTGTWMVWDAEEDEYVDTSVNAQGPEGERGPQGIQGPAGTDGQDGAPGEDGQDGVSPSVETTEISGGHRVAITDAEGTSTFDVMDGTDGQDGAPGQQGPAGQDGQDGQDGYTPVRGTDYWTAEDKAEIVGDVEDDIIDDTAGEGDTDKTWSADKLSEETTFEKTLDQAAIQSFEDGAEWPMRMQIAVDPVQDLHGYDNPWPAGGGKNLFPLKAKNSYTSHGITFTPKVDDDGNVISIIVNGTNDGTASSVYDTVTGTVPTASARQTDIDFSKSYLFTGAQSENIALNLWAYDSNGTYIYGYYNRSTSATTINNSNIVSYVPIIEIRNGVTVNNVEVKPMLRLSTVSDSTFEPYTNICPITGFDGANVTVTKKNLLPTTIEKLKQDNINGTWNGDVYKYVGLDFEVKTNSYGLVTSIDVSGTTTSGSYPTMNIYFTLPAGNYIVSSDNTYRFFKNGERIHNSSGNFDLTVDSRTDELRFALFPGTGTVSGKSYAPMIRLATEQDGTFEPFSSVYPITFPTSAGTVYGGNLTVNKDGTGTLVVDRTSIIASSSNITGVVTSASGAWTSITPSSVAKFVSNKVTLLCSQAMSVTFDDRVSNTYKNYTRAYIDDFGRVIIRASASSGINTVEGMKNLFDGAVIVYTLATPITYTLTPGQVLSLIGKNNVWADTGDILSLTYNSKQGMEFIREDTAGQINTVVNPVKTELSDAEAAMAIVVDGDTAPKNITSGQYVFVKNHSTLATGMYHATAAISSGTSITGKVEADADGGFNAIKNIFQITSKIFPLINANSSKPFNCTASARIVAFCNGRTDGLQAILIISTNAANTTLYVSKIAESGKGGDITYSLSGNILTINNNSVADLTVSALIIQGDITKEGW